MSDTDLFAVRAWPQRTPRRARLSLVSTVEEQPMTPNEWSTRTLAPILIACAAVALGVAFYAFARPQPALFLPAGWHRPQTHALPAALVGGLPTFVHTLAMSLLTAALLQPRRRVGLRTICVAWCAVEIAFESAQHPRLGHALLDALPASERWRVLLSPLANFVRTGTFDGNDVVAAALASLTAYAVLCHAIERQTTHMEARHV